MMKKKKTTKTLFLLLRKIECQAKQCLMKMKKRKNRTQEHEHRQPDFRFVLLYFQTSALILILFFCFNWIIKAE